MKVLIVSGIFPPDIGGPATHAADVRDELVARGHDVMILTLTDEARAVTTGGLLRLPRRWPWPVRMTAALAWFASRGRKFDVVYATGLGPVAVAGARLAGRPVVLKIVGDPAWERGVRRGLTHDEFDSFQESRGGPPTLRAMRRLRDWSTRHATTVIAPSPHLALLVGTWAQRNDVQVVPNGVRVVGPSAQHHPDDHPGLRLVFVGRLVAHKNVDVMIDAVARVDHASLEIVGDGPELGALRTQAERLGIADRITFAGSLPHDTAMQRMAAADALVLASGYEGLPHVVLEALASGTPVVTASAHGLSEVITDGFDGVLVPDTTADALCDVFARLASDPPLRDRLRVGAAETGRQWSLARCIDQLEELLGDAAGHLPAAVFLGKTKMPTPPTPDDEQKYEINQRHVSSFVVCTGSPPGIRRPAGANAFALPGLRPPVGSAVFYSAGPFLALVRAISRRPSAVVCQSPFEAFGVALLRPLLPARIRPRLQVEVHGDWRTASRLYGGERRRLVGPAADRVAEWTLRRADRVRVVSEWLGGLVRDAGYRGAMDRFIAFSDYNAFLGEPVVEPPTEPRALFVGVLERYKAVDVLLDSWAMVVQQVPNARLTIVGKGSCRQEIERQIDRMGLGDRVRLRPPMPRPELRGFIDDASCLVLPSRSEGLGRIILEAMARGRPVVASRVGGISELVDDGDTGRLVPAEDAPALAQAIVEVLCDTERAHRMGAEARRRAVARDPLREYERGIERLAGWIATS